MVSLKGEKKCKKEKPNLLHPKQFGIINVIFTYDCEHSCEHTYTHVCTNTVFLGKHFMLKLNSKEKHRASKHKKLC